VVGNPTYDTWGTVGGSAGYGVVSNETFVGETQLTGSVWVGDTLGTLADLVGDPLIQAPGDWSFGLGNGAGNKTGQSQSSGCGDNRDQLIKEYSNPSYPADFTPLCADFMPSSNVKPSVDFTYHELDISNISRSEFPEWAILRSSLLTGLESIRAGIGNRPVNVDSGYRSPKVNDVLSSGITASRHIHGDAADMLTGGAQAVFDDLKTAALDANACVEPQDLSGLAHVHADWRPRQRCAVSWLQQ
jgi:hypothetical protein